MLLRELTSSLDEKRVWAKSGKKVVRKFRCTTGRRKGRVVAKIGQCFAAPDMKKRFTLKKTRARLGARIARKARKTKRTSAVSKAVQRLNKASSRRR